MRQLFENGTYSGGVGAYSSKYGMSLFVGRLHLQITPNVPVGGWLSKYNDQHQWLQVRFGQKFEIRRVATQGRANVNQWVTSYTLNYSTDGLVFNQYQTNTDQTVSEVHFYTL